MNALVCPLNWGLGHATRVIPLIRVLREKGHRVILGASGRPLALLKQEFPELIAFDFPDYGIRCPRDRSLVFRLMLRLPLLLLRIRKERKKLAGIIREYGIDIVYSDNRYGLWQKGIPCILITHQLMLKLPACLRFAEDWVHRAGCRWLKKFNEIWIPDSTGEMNLSGDLSHRYPLPENARFVGWMSRFDKGSGREISVPGETGEKQWDILALISGPEPQRTFFQEKLLNQLKQSGLCCCMLEGKPGATLMEKWEGNILRKAHAADAELLEIVNQSSLLICRPGYSTLMDLIYWNRPAILIPTPGQTEQEYLSARLLEKKWFYSCPQKRFLLPEAIQEVKKYTGFPKTLGVTGFFNPQVPESD